MIRLAAASGAVVVIAVLASAVNGQEPETPGRFQLTAEGEGFLRLDTETGEVSYCAPVDGLWRCEPADTPGATAAALAGLSERLTAIEDALAELLPAERDDAAPDPVTTELAALRDQVAAIETLLSSDDAAAAAEREETAEALEAMSERLGENRSAIAALAERQPELAEALESVAADQLVLAEALADLTAAVRAAPPELDEIAQDVDALAEDVNGLAANQTELIARLAEEPPPEDIAALFDALHRDQAEAAADIQTSLAALAGRLEAVETELAEAPQPPDLSPALAAIEERLGAIEAAVAPPPVESDDSGLETAIETLTIQVEAIAEEQALLADTIAAFGPPALDADGITGALDAALAELGEATIAEIERGAADDAAANAEIRTAIEELKGTVEALSDSVAAERNDDTAERLAAIEERLADLAETVDEADETDRLADLAARIEALAAGQDAILEIVADLSAAEPTAIEGDPIPDRTGADSPGDTDADAGAEDEGVEDADQPADPPGFGEELILRLYDLVDGLKRGLGG